MELGDFWVGCPLRGFFKWQDRDSLALLRNFGQNVHVFWDLQYVFLGKVRQCLAAFKALLSERFQSRFLNTEPKNTFYRFVPLFFLRGHGHGLGKDFVKSSIWLIFSSERILP